MKAGNQTLLKKNNQKAIIDYIIRNGAISRADLAKRLSISKPTVSANVADLIENKIVKEIGYSETEVGKKPMLLDFNKQYKYVIALDFISYYTRNIVSFAICNLYCEPIFIQQIGLCDNYGKNEIENDVPTIIMDFIKKKKIPKDKIGRVVITAPSIVRDNVYAKFVCKNSDIVNLIEVFSKCFPEKIEVKNDINLAALGEKYFGVGKDHDTIAFFWVGYAMGSGIIINGSLYEGPTKIAGEVGHTIICSPFDHSYTSIDNLLSKQNLINHFKADCNNSKNSIIGEKLSNGTFHFHDIIDAFNKNDSYCVDFVTTIIKSISIVIANICATLDLEMVILGGDYTRFGDIFVNEVKNAIDKIYFCEAKVATAKFDNSAMFGSFKLGSDYVIENLI